MIHDHQKWAMIKNLCNHFVSGRAQVQRATERAKRGLERKSTFLEEYAAAPSRECPCRFLIFIDENIFTKKCHRKNPIC